MEAIDILKREKERITKLLNRTNSQISEFNEEIIRLKKEIVDYEETIKNIDATIIKSGVDSQNYPLFKKIERERKEAVTGDYISLRVPKPGDVPIVEFNGEVLENFESIKFVWITRGMGMDDPIIICPYFLDIQGLRTLDVDGEQQYECYRIGLGKETEVEKFRKIYEKD
ncbi:hypothetical protein [Rummeliibacillus stabekisii]|uniref:Uncharacterized protein n=1 Tax=Rummeliibacillus stabekisii TaxID=241244 RepID=A0A143H9N6_9BACL|nr:hypothetical protein [Rummeliibacillus stabekisii]AMW98444.1 hypothetical protein ATY39_02745 [Rummeliibacillus stabekisii]